MRKKIICLSDLILLLYSLSCLNRNLKNYFTLFSEFYQTIYSVTKYYDVSQFKILQMIFATSRIYIYLLPRHSRCFTKSLLPLKKHLYTPLLRHLMDKVFYSTVSLPIILPLSKLPLLLSFSFFMWPIPVSYSRISVSLTSFRKPNQNHWESGPLLPYHHHTMHTHVWKSITLPEFVPLFLIICKLHKGKGCVFYLYITMT